MFVSRHIYILASSLVHLALGAYVAPASKPLARALQRVSSGLLVASTVLLVTAFVVEAVAGRPRTIVSSLGLYTLFAGTLLHFAAAGRAPRG